MGLRWPFSGGNQKGPKSVNIFLGFFFMVNFCLGTGFLGVPFSFFYAGYLASIPTLLLVAFVSWNNAEWEIETMARAQVGCVETHAPSISLSLSLSLTQGCGVLGEGGE